MPLDLFTFRLNKDVSSLISKSLPPLAFSPLLVLTRTIHVNYADAFSFSRLILLVLSLVGSVAIAANKMILLHLSLSVGSKLFL